MLCILRTADVQTQYNVPAAPHRQCAGTWGRGSVLDFLKAYNLHLILIISTAVSFFWLTFFKKELRIKWYAALIIAVLHTLIGVVCVKFFAWFEGLIGPGEAGNLSLYGGVLLMPLFYFLGAKIFRRDIRMVFDIMSFPLIFTLFCSRFNCLINGCCQGLIIPGTDFRYPTREAEIVFYAILLHILGTKIFKKRFDGKVYPIYMLCYGIFRFIVEWFRESFHIFGFIHISHIWSVLSACIGLGFLIYLSKNTPQDRSKKIPKKDAKNRQKASKPA